jgi:hypothetical protein
VEHPFGTIKSWMGATHFQMKTLKHVSTAMAVHLLAYNMKTGDAYSGRCRIDGSDPRLKGLWHAHGARLSKTPAFLHSLREERTF